MHGAADSPSFCISETLVELVEGWRQRRGGGIIVVRGAGARWLLGDCNGMKPTKNECLMTGLPPSPGTPACMQLFPLPSVSRLTPPPEHPIISHLRFDISHLRFDSPVLKDAVITMQIFRGGVE